MAPHPLSEQLKTARGQTFVRLLRQIYAESSPLLAEQAQQVIARKGKLTAIDVGRLAIEFNLQLKHAFEFLEWQQVLPSGTYERLRDRGLKVKDVMERAETSDLE